MRPDRLSVTIFADFTCPFCYVTERALLSLAERHRLEVRPKALELYPAPAALPDPPQDPGELATAAPLAAERAMKLAPPSFRPRTRKAHEAAAFAAGAGAEAARGAGGAMRRAIYDAYWREGSDIGRIDVLMALAERVGLDPIELRIALDIDRERDVVLADQALAERLGVTQVPTLYLGSGAGAVILQGARPLAALDEALAAG